MNYAIRSLINYPSLSSNTLDEFTFFRTIAKTKKYNTHINQSKLKTYKYNKLH